MIDTLLLIEDEALLASELARHFRRGGWEVVSVKSLAAARGVLTDERLDPLVVLSDVSLPDGNALDLLEEVRERGEVSEWIFLTAYGTITDAVRAMRLEANDFIEKPCDLDRLDLLISGAARSARAQRRLRDREARRGGGLTAESFVGRSAAAIQVRELVVQLSQLPLSSLVLEGETGTGKGLVARILHYTGGRAHGPLVEVNCAALPPTLLESELFGHEHGAFTGSRGRRRGVLEQAHQGTLLLDEIGDLDLPLQGKLLTAVEERKFRRVGAEQEIAVDVAIVAATNRDLRQLVREGSFRADLYHRLKVFSLPLPPLRERLEDLDDLVPRFVAELCARTGKKITSIPDEVWGQFRAYGWPGNVRELRNVIERSVLLSTGEALSTRWLQLGESMGPAPQRTSGPSLVLPLDGSMTLEEMDREVIERALELSQHNVTAAARALGTTRETLRYRIQKYGLGEG